MAKASAHKLGQMIGEFLEKQFEHELTEICSRRNLYLDVVGKVRRARKGKKVTWLDVYGSKHDLDFVIERNGTNDQLGTPAALIECAWRRYTKHSKNKAQEIQGAILPIAEKYKYHKPFLGAVVAGVFTAPSVEQLNSCGFETIYFEYENILKAFNEIDINIFFSEDTPDNEAEEKIEALKTLSDEQFDSVFKRIVELSREEVDRFMTKLEQSLDRQVSQIVIAPLFGVSKLFETIDDAIEYLGDFQTSNIPNDAEFSKFFIQIEYSNNDKVTGEFSSQHTAVSFLENTVGI